MKTCTCSLMATRGVFLSGRFHLVHFCIQWRYGTSVDHLILYFKVRSEKKKKEVGKWEEDAPVHVSTVPESIGELGQGLCFVLLCLTFFERVRDDALNF